MNLNHFLQQLSNDHIHISLDIVMLGGEGAGPLLPLSSPLCTRLRDEAEGMDDERGTLDI